MALLVSKLEARAWDFFFAVALLFPLLSGGIWIRQPGLKLEFTQAGPAALLLGLWFWQSQRVGRTLGQKSFFIPLLRRAWDFWCTGLAQFPARALTTAWIFFGTIWFAASWGRHSGFASNAIDLGIFTNAFWNLATTGAPFAALKSGHSLFTDHQSFTIFPITWIFQLYPGPGILLFLQAFGLSAGGIGLYLLGRQRLDREHALLPLLPFCYWLYFPTRAAIVFDFHPEVLMLPLFLFGVWGLQENSWRNRALGLICFLGGMASKESGGPVAVGLGLAWWLGAGPAQRRGWQRILGTLAIVGGAALFYFDTKVMPLWFGAEYIYGNVYEPFGSSLDELALAPFRHTTEFFSRLFGPTRLQFLFKILLPLAFLPLLFPRALVAALPGFCMLFLAAGSQRLSLGFHYTIEPSVGIFLALVGACSLPAVKKWERPLLLLLPCLLLSTYGRSEAFHWRFYSLTPHQTWLRNEILPKIDATASVGATNVLVPHLAIRHWSHFLPILPTEEKKNVDCVLWERSLNNAPMSESEAIILQAALAENYELEYTCGTFTLHRSKEFTRACATGLPACPPPAEAIR